MKNCIKIYLGLLIAILLFTIIAFALNDMV